MSQQAFPLLSRPDEASSGDSSRPHGAASSPAATFVANGGRLNDSTRESPPPVELNKLRQAQHADGQACILAVGTANPAKCISQEKFTDWYFRVTRSDHLIDLKGIMKKTCAQVEVRKRYMQVTEELLDAHPELLDPAIPSIDARLQAVAAALPELAAAAAAKAIAEWGRPAADITHLVVSTSSGTQMPGVDVRVASLLGLSPTVRRTMMYFQACTGGAAALRFAKDAAENNRGARVLVVCADVLSVMGFRAPDADEEARGHEGIVAHAVFGDGAGAVVVGADPTPLERPVFEMVSAAQTTIPGTERFVTGDLSAAGVGYSLAPGEVPALVRDNIERCLAAALDPLGLPVGGEWNSLFWVVHPGMATIMKAYEKALRLEPGKLEASRRVLSEYGNMVGPTVIFVLDEVVRLRLRRRRRRQDVEAGHCEWGVLVGLGPGFTAEVIALRSMPLHAEEV